MKTRWLVWFSVLIVMVLDVHFISSSSVEQPQSGYTAWVDRRRVHIVWTEGETTPVPAAVDAGFD